jgi:hypothetical protein
MALTPDSLADKLAPKLQAILRARQDEIVAGAGGLPRRAAVRLAFPTFLDEVPVLLRSAIELISDEFGRMNINDLIAFLEAHATQPWR